MLHKRQSYKHYKGGADKGVTPRNPFEAIITISQHGVHEKSMNRKQAAFTKYFGVVGGGVESVHSFNTKMQALVKPLS